MSSDPRFPPTSISEIMIPTSVFSLSWARKMLTAAVNNARTEGTKI